MAKLPAVRRKSSSAPLAARQLWFRLRAMLTWKFMRPIVFDPARSWIAATLLLLVEVPVCYVVIQKVAYTEIDWRAYMQEVDGVLNGTYDYAMLRGDTGPLVYPAGFVWIYAGLRGVTDGGRDVRAAQYVFAGIYLAMLALVFRLLVKSAKVPPYVLVLLSLTSYRIHSIFLLRLFNDPVAMTFLYAAINCFISDYWSLGSVLFSLAVSVKMNILLFAPALFLVYLSIGGPRGALLQVGICAAVQAALAAPFMLHNPVGYIAGAFDIGRVFLFKWTVNWKFVSEWLFVHRGFHLALLACHLVALLLSARPWLRLLAAYAKLRKDATASSASGALPATACQLLLMPLFMANFIGMVFARSLHYQFYVWYYHQLPYLAWCTDLPVVVRLLLLGLLEMCWNTYPATASSSAVMQACHAALAAAIARYLWVVTCQTETVVKKGS